MEAFCSRTTSPADHLAAGNALLVAGAVEGRKQSEGVRIVRAECRALTGRPSTALPHRPVNARPPHIAPES